MLGQVCRSIQVNRVMEFFKEASKKINFIVYDHFCPQFDPNTGINSKALSMMVLMLLTNSAVHLTRIVGSLPILARRLSIMLFKNIRIPLGNYGVDCTNVK